eukprot:m.183029 g.183029  ORF g.183029 m.183029 type:complete len:116 (+) comp14684_c0_seq2:210-557(+)
MALQRTAFFGMAAARQASQLPRVTFQTRLMATKKVDPLEQSMLDKLKAELNTQTVEVEDMSGGCGSAFRVLVESEAFRGMPSIKQHRLVKSILKDEIAQIHAIQVHTAVPEQSTQ